MPSAAVRTIVWGGAVGLGVAAFALTMVRVGAVPCHSPAAAGMQLVPPIDGEAFSFPCGLGSAAHSPAGASTAGAALAAAVMVTASALIITQRRAV